MRLDPDNNAARAQLSQLLLLGGDPDEALIQAEELIDRGGEPGHLLRAQALDRLDRTDEAFTEYELAIAATPDESAPVAIYAQALSRHGDREAAERTFRKLIEMAPSFSSQTSLGAFIAQDRTRDEEAEQIFLDATRLAEAEEKVSAHQNVASFYFQRERFDDATAYLEGVIPTVEKTIPLIYLLARLSAAQGNTDKPGEILEVDLFRTI